MAAAPSADATFATICKVATAASNVVSSRRVDYQIHSLVVRMELHLSSSPKLLCRKSVLGKRKKKDAYELKFIFLFVFVFCVQIVLLCCRVDQPCYCDWKQKQNELRRRTH